MISAKNIVNYNKDYTSSINTASFDKSPHFNNLLSNSLQVIYYSGIGGDKT